MFLFNRRSASVLEPLNTKSLDDRRRFWYSIAMAKSKVIEGTGARTTGKTKEPNLPELAGWDSQTRTAFEYYLLKLKTTPTARSIVDSMIKFQNMYQPLNENPLGFNLSGRLSSVNGIRREKRTRSYLHQKDLIKAVDEDGGKTLILTTRAHKIFYRRFPLARLRKEKWDGYWSLVTYDFPETMRTTRNYLREKLIDFGFGSPQESLLLTPLPLTDPVQELLEGDKLSDYVWVVRANRVVGLSNQEIAEKAWDLRKINGFYQKLLDVLPRLGKSSKLQNQWRKHFLAIFLDDPYLPRELLPRDWVGELCQKEAWRLGLPQIFRLLLR